MEVVSLTGTAARRGGVERLAAHCAVLERLAWSNRATARERLEHELGDSLAHRLVDALVAGDPPRAALGLS